MPWFRQTAARPAAALFHLAPVAVQSVDRHAARLSAAASEGLLHVLFLIGNACRLAAPQAPVSPFPGGAVSGAAGQTQKNGSVLAGKGQPEGEWRGEDETVVVALEFRAVVVSQRVAVLLSETHVGYQLLPFHRAKVIKIG